MKNQNTHTFDLVEVLKFINRNCQNITSIIFYVAINLQLINIKDCVLLKQCHFGEFI